MAGRLPERYMQQLQQAQLALRAGQAQGAEQRLRALLAMAPGEVNAAWLLGAALLDLERIPEALGQLEQVLAAAPEFAEARVDLARALRAGGQAEAAREQVRRVLERHPHHHRGWLAYGDILVDLGQYTDAQVAFERARLTDPRRKDIEQATAALLREDRREPEEIFRDILKSDPSHVAALCGLAAVSLLADKPADAERLLRHAMKQSPHVPLASRGLGPVLVALGKLEEAERTARYLLKIEPRYAQSWITIAAVATRLMRQEEALAAYEQAAALDPDEIRIRMSIGHVQKTLGRRAQSEGSYKTALQKDPGWAEAWWSLADLKNYTFTDAEMSTMRDLLERDPRGRSNQAQLNFALGRACEQRAQWAHAFAHYARGNALRRQEAPFDIDAFERRSERIRAFFDQRFFAEHRDAGTPDPSPIFIIGLPRSGSTLIEQILASHPAVEGTMELPNVLNYVRELDDRIAGRNGYPQTVSHLSDADLTGLGRRYLAETAPLRSGRERFTDKMPNNFSHVGLIHAILPRAVIVDARRHPMDACFSSFKQYFAEGQTFSYDLTDLGRYYRCYLALMDHWDAVLPGKVLRVQYEQLVRDPEPAVRRLLAHCGLAFDPACLRFHETRRSVRTASAEQVRQPLYTSGVGYWRHFERELAPLAQALGDALDRFPEHPPAT